MTAHDVVGRVRRLSGERQVGHAGTLDPMAHGVLPIAVGRACRLLRFLPDDKVYLAKILFGQRTDTDDIEGAVIARSDHLPCAGEIGEALHKFRGKIEQIPPMYSAVHVDGRRLYELARRGEVVAEIPTRHVEVFSIEQLSFSLSTISTDSLLKAGTGQELEPAGAGTELSEHICADSAATYSDASAIAIKIPGESASSIAESRGIAIEPGHAAVHSVAYLELRIHCSSGTYIRSIARDLGDLLGSAACLAGLKRERAGLFEIEKSFSLEQLAELASASEFASALEAVEQRLPQPRVSVTAEQAKRLTFGQRLNVKSDEINNTTPGLSAIHKNADALANCVLAIFQEKLVAVCSIVDDPSGVNANSFVELKPEVVLSDGSAV